MTQLSTPSYKTLKDDELARFSKDKNYEFKSDKFYYSNGCIYYARTPEVPFNLKRYFIPPDKVCPTLKSLSDDQAYTNTALALADLTVRRSKNNNPSRMKIQKSITFYWNTMLYFRSLGVFYLKDVSQEDIHIFCQKYANGGWYEALNIEDKVKSIINKITKEQFLESIHLLGTSKNVVDALKVDFWNTRIGFLPETFFTESKKLFEAKGKSFGFTFADRWEHKYTSGVSLPTIDSMRNLMMHLNYLYYLPNSVDKFQFFPFENIKHSSKKYSQRLGQRTANLSLNDATYVLGKSLDWIYLHGPLLVSALKLSRSQLTNSSTFFKKNFLHCNNPFKEFSESLGISIPRLWAAKPDPSKADKAIDFSVNYLIGALQGACAIAIAGFNARRSSEIAGAEVGIRISDLIFDENLNIQRVNFYIEKSYQERHSFYVNQTSSDAINLLIELKKACLPEDALTIDLPENDPLFTCHKLKLYGRSPPVAFFFANSVNQSRSLNSFLSLLDDDHKNIELNSHVWRRFFALLYIYRYDHSNLQSLSQHLRHMDINQTKIYTTDNNARSNTEKISVKITSNKQDRINEARLLNSLLEENRELNEVIDIVAKEKFNDTVCSILNAERQSGGFPRLVRKLYIAMSKDMNFSCMEESEKVINITHTLVSKGYACLPMPHGQCNAPTGDYIFAARCSNNGHLERDRASASFCQKCMFHSKNDYFVNNLVAEIALLDEDISSDETPEFIRTEAVIAKQVLIDIIEIHDHSAQQNSILMRELVENAKK